MGAIFNLSDVNTITWIDDRFDNQKYFVTVYVKESRFQEKMTYESLKDLLDEWANYNGEDVDTSEKNIGILDSKDW